MPIANGSAIATAHGDLLRLDIAAQGIEILAFGLTLALSWRMLRPLQRATRGSFSLHRDERASASLEFLLVFFPLLVLVLAVWQLAFMINAQIHVGLRRLRRRPQRQHRGIYGPPGRTGRRTAQPR